MVFAHGGPTRGLHQRPDVSLGRTQLTAWSRKACGVSAALTFLNNFVRSEGEGYAGETSCSFGVVPALGHEGHRLSTQGVHISETGLLALWKKDAVTTNQS